MSDKPRCKTCAFYRRDEHSTYCGSCRVRLPPGVRCGTYIVQENIDTCDLHKPKEAATTNDGRTTLHLLVGRGAGQPPEYEPEPLGLFTTVELAEQFRDAHFEECIRNGLYDEEDRDSDDFDLEVLYSITTVTINPEASKP